MKHGVVGYDRRLWLLGVCSLSLAASLYAVGLHLTAAFVVVVAASLAISVITLRLYRPGAEPVGLARQWEFSPQELGGFSYWQLALVSIFGLFLELLMIRWVSSEINVFAYFKNFVLISCFLGFGLGCYMSHRRVQLAALLLPLLALAFVCASPWSALRRLVDILPSVLGASSRVEIWGLPTLPTGGLTLSLFAGAVIFIVLLFALIAFVFVPIGQIVGWYLEHASNGILGYTVNILGSLVGIGAYTFLCFLWLPPAVWFLVAGAMLAALLWRLPRQRLASIAAFLACIGMSLLGTLEVNQHLDIDAFLTPSKNSRVYWSPYQELAVTPTYLGREVISYLVTANGSQHQWIFNFSSAFVHSHPKLFADAPADWNHYNLPYRFFPHPASVLVLGAGTGNDAAAALRNGAGRLVAVEIDPLIVNLGRRLHFEQPYSSPRVHVIVDDARSYMQNRHDPFDLIMFSFLDSKTNSSYYSNIRIDNYVYTVEAFQAAKRLLKPDGLMIIKFYARMPWIAGRLEQLAHTAFGQPPLQLNTVPFGGRIFVCGSRAKLAQALRDPRVAAYVASHSNVPMEQAPITTDDWPYFYQHEPGLPASWIIISIVLITLCLYFLRETGTPPGSLRWHFFFLGAGFMLLETQIVSKMALLFGTTWMVNSVVIAGLLILIVASNFLVEWKPRIAYGAAYAGIFASIALAYFVPLETFFFPSIWMKELTASAVLCLPVFFAGIVFIRSFARDGFRSEALGSNLMGALIGGLLESLSMWTGMRSLLVIATLLYLASWLTLSAQQSRAADAPEIAEPDLKLAAR